jgi:hypothetical protein
MQSTPVLENQRLLMPILCRVQIDGGTAQVVNPVATVIFQITPTASTAVRIINVELQSNQFGPTENLPKIPPGPSSQQVIFLQLGTYSGAPSSSGGLTPLAVPADDALVGLYTPSTTFRTLSPNMGTAFIPSSAYQWNTADPFGYHQGFSFDQGIKSPAVWALIMPQQFIPSGQRPFSITGFVDFIEDH